MLSQHSPIARSRSSATSCFETHRPLYTPLPSQVSLSMTTAPHASELGSTSHTDYKVLSQANPSMSGNATARPSCIPGGLESPLPTQTSQTAFSISGTITTPHCQRIATNFTFISPSSRSKELNKDFNHRSNY